LNDFNISIGKSFGYHGTAFPGLSPMGNIAYQWTDNLMTYFKISRGFQSGNINGQATNPLLFTPFEPEKLWAYEGGMKSQWLDNRLRLNLSGFLSRYTDQVISVTQFSQVGGLQVQQQNAGESEFWGFELEAMALPVRGVEVNLNYAYLNTKYLKWLTQKFTPAGLPLFDPVTGQPVLENVATFAKVALSPDNTVSVGLTYTAPPTTAGVFSAHVDAYWQDRSWNHPLPPHYDKSLDYAIVNGRLQFTEIPLQKGTLDIAAFGRNLSNTQYRSFGFDLGSLGWAVNTFGDPRTFGLQLTYNFTEGEAAPPPAPVAQAAPPPPPPAKKKIVLRSVHFDFDKATLKAEAKPILDEAVQVLKQEGSVDIVVEGHTDSLGTDQYNLGLSRRRAETVRTYLVDHGIAQSRITAEGLGESKPLASNDTADGRAQNRRVELHVK
jgi:outer membrane protein OmpA-like peptidoglycan-associated protein